MKTSFTHISKKNLVILLGDLLILYGTLYAVLNIRYFSRQGGILLHKHLAPFTVIFFLWMIMFGAFGLYDLKLMKNGKIFLYRLMQAMALNTALAIIVFYIFPFEIEPRRNLFLITISATLLIFLWRYLFNLLILRASSTRIAFIGITGETMDLVSFLLRHPQIGYKPVAFFSNGKTLFSPPAPLVSPVPEFSLAEENFARVIRETKADTIVISPEMKENRILVKDLIAVMPLAISIAEFPAFHEMITGKIPLSLIEEIWFLENLIGIKKRSYEFTNRVVDIMLATIVSIPVLILFPFIALAIKLDSRGPLFFRQTRVGKNGTIFEILKFRSTYRTSVSAYEGRRKDQDAGVYTRTGIFLRKSYLDELPQLINVLKGEMSFIGPRPERPEFVDEFKVKVSFYEMRLLALPGLTGWAQINMKDDASVEDAPEKMQYDLYYIKNRSFILDLLIMLRTIFTLLRREGR